MYVQREYFTLRPVHLTMEIRIRARDLFDKNLGLTLCQIWRIRKNLKEPVMTWTKKIGNTIRSINQESSPKDSIYVENDAMVEIEPPQSSLRSRFNWVKYVCTGFTGLSAKLKPLQAGLFEKR